MDDATKSIWNKVRTGEIDINNQQLFFLTIAKGFIYKLNQNLKLRGQYIPHYILNTGDDIMYLEIKGQDHSIEPIDVSNEKFIYSQVPRCMVQPAGVNIQTDQLTNPYAHGNFQIEYDDMLYDFHAEFRRIPLTYAFTLKYHFDSYTDAMDIIQQMIANLAFINIFNVTYLGQRIECSYNLPDAENAEYMMEFDGITTDSKYRTISLDLDVSTNMPIVRPDTAIPASAIIKKTCVGELVEFGSKPHPDNVIGYTGIRVFPKGGIDVSAGEMSSENKEMTTDK